jgi:hypothetical protein
MMALNILQFRADVAEAMVAGTRKQELRVTDLKKLARTPFCFKEMTKVFHPVKLDDWEYTDEELIFAERGGVKSQWVRPYMVCGQTTAIKDSCTLVELLFGDEDFPAKGYRKPRTGAWHKKPYRYYFKETLDLIESLLGAEALRTWMEQFLQVMVLTHWLLPYAAHNHLLPLTTSLIGCRGSGLMQWFSTVVVNPHEDLGKVNKWIAKHVEADALWTFTPKGLIAEYSIVHDIDVYDTKTRQPTGRFRSGINRHSTVTGPRFMTGRPLKLGMVEVIRDMAMDELDDLMATWFMRPSHTPVHLMDLEGEESDSRWVDVVFGGEASDSEAAEAEGSSDEVDDETPWDMETEAALHTIRLVHHR